MKLFFLMKKKIQVLLMFFFMRRKFLTINRKIYVCSIKINRELYILINNNKIVDYNQRFSLEAKDKNVIFYEGKLNIVFSLKLGP
jgi:hypothetical protein